MGEGLTTRGRKNGEASGEGTLLDPSGEGTLLDPSGEGRKIFPQGREQRGEKFCLVKKCYIKNYLRYIASN